MRDFQKRLLYLAFSLVVTTLGLASRHSGEYLPNFVSGYAGDTLWALLVFLAISLMAPHTSSYLRGLIAVGFAYVIELSQLYHAPWIDAVRNTTLGGLVLGIGFLWSDLVCYAVGVSMGVAVDTLVCFKPRDR